MKQGATILLVEDQGSVREAMWRLLKRAGHTLEAVDNGAAALELLKQRPFDLVITDLSMPGVRGDQLIAAIRQMLPSQAILMVTAYVGENKDLFESGHGPDAVLMKPFFFTELIAAICAVLAKRRPPSS